MVLHFVGLCARVLRVDGGLRQIRNKKPEVKLGATILVTNCDGLQESERGKTRQIDIKNSFFSAQNNYIINWTFCSECGGETN